MFLCFKRRHYNKSPVVWISNYLYWQDNCPELAKLLEESTIALDEYPVEHTHSIVRRSTNITDEPNIVIRKVKNVFSNKESQKNFRATFGHVKNFTFAKNKLKKMKLKAARFLLKLFRDIANQKSQAGRKTVAGKVKWTLPTILPGSELDERVLPLGFQTSCPPNSTYACDHQQCDQPTDTSKPWYICEGCCHSYHNQCLQEGLPCSICQDFIKTRAKDLAQTAKEAVLLKNDGTNEQAEDENEDDSDDDGDADELSSSFSSSISDDNIDREIAKLNNEAKNLKPPSLTSVAAQTSDDAAFIVRKGPHCRICNHSVKGHSKKDDVKICQQCPEKKCARNGRTVECCCDWHTAQKEVCHNAPPSQTPSVSHSSQQSSTASTPSSSTLTSSLTTRNQPTPWPSFPNGQTNTILLPSSMSQSNIGGRNGSNACTIISALIVKMHLERTLPPPIRQGQLSPTFVYVFIKTIVTGNQLYDKLSRQLSTINLYVQEVVNNLPNLKLKCVAEESHITLQSLQAKLETKAYQNSVSACIAVLPSDKSLSILFEATGEMWIIDSHSHGNHGPLVAYLPYSNVRSVSGYLDRICAKYWNSKAVGADTTVLELS